LAPPAIRVMPRKAAMMHSRSTSAKSGVVMNAVLPGSVREGKG
jgi:hypothetical protein